MSQTESYSDLRRSESLRELISMPGQEHRPRNAQEIRHALYIPVRRHSRSQPLTDGVLKLSQWANRIVSGGSLGWHRPRSCISRRALQNFSCAIVSLMRPLLAVAFPLHNSMEPYNSTVLRHEGRRPSALQLTSDRPSSISRRASFAAIFLRVFSWSSSCPTATFFN